MTKATIKKALHNDASDTIACVTSFWDQPQRWGEKHETISTSFNYRLLNLSWSSLKIKSNIT